MMHSFRRTETRVKSFAPHPVPEYRSDSFPKEVAEGDLLGNELLRGVLRDDNGPERVGAMIHKAAKQLQDYECPKVLVFVNDEIGLDVHDLEAAYRGHLVYEGPAGHAYVDRSATRVARGRIQSEKRLIDLYIWLERREAPAFRFTAQAGRSLAERCFNYKIPVNAEPVTPAAPGVV
jgi:hypothetical protein